jgi:chitin synthase
MIEKTRYFTYLFVSFFKIVTFFATAWLAVGFNGVLQPNQAGNLFNKFSESFAAHNVVVTEIEDIVLGDGSHNSDAEEDSLDHTISSDVNLAFAVLAVQVGCTYGAYIFAKFACKVQIQGFSFAVPLCSIIPLCMTLLLVGCGLRASDACAFHDSVPDYLGMQCPAVGDYFTYLWDDQLWLWFLWFLSQLWITMHIWFPKSQRLASTEQIFGTPMYNSLFIDQSIVLNRRRDGDNDFNFEELRDEIAKDKMADFYDRFGDEGTSTHTGGSAGNNKNKKDVRHADKITKVYGCATMWHESREEMIEMLKSVFRVDMDYSARRLAQKYLQVIDPDYYEFETHFLFDDAFQVGDTDKGQEEEQVVNQ